MIGRHRILEVHGQGKPLATGVDLLAVARRTPGFTGADLANVLNEAALLTARTDKKLIDDEVLDEAIDRVIAGPQKRTRIMSAKERKITAYHEGGHALVASAMNHLDPVTKVTILPRGRALGYTMVMPTDDKYSTTRNEMLDQLAYALGGRVAEEIIFHDPTTGAANDIEKATAMAREMVTEYGMSERVGAVKLGQSQGEVFLGRDMGHQRDYSEQVAADRRRGGARARRRRARRGLARSWSTTTATSSTSWCSSCSRRRRSTQAELAEIFKDIVKRPVRPTWLSSERRTLVRPPAGADPGRAAARERPSNGFGDRVDATATGDPRTQAEIDAAARPAPTRLRGHPRRRSSRCPRSTRRALSRRTDDAVSRLVDVARAEAAVREFLLAIGEDPDRDGPARHPRPGRPGRTPSSSPGSGRTPPTCCRRPSRSTTTSS